MRKMLLMLAGLFLGLVTAAVVFVVGMRRRSQLVIDTVRRAARATKRLPLKTAGTPGAYASVVRHAGRNSGREYQTPVRAVATADGFVIALPYGSNSDWVKNVLAQGTAVLVQGGHAYSVSDPVVVPLEEVQDTFSASDQRAHRLFGVTECLVVTDTADGRRVTSGEGLTALRRT